jgi:hypothetical protein
MELRAYGFNFIFFNFGLFLVKRRLNSFLIHHFKNNFGFPTYIVTGIK